MNKRTFFPRTASVAALLLFAFTASQAQQFELTSPDGKLKIAVDTYDHITYSVSHNGEPLLLDCEIAMDLGTTKLGKNTQVSRHTVNDVSEMIHPVTPMKFSTVENNYKRLRLDMKGNYSVEFRAFDDGFAYRLITNLRGEIDVISEDITLRWPNGVIAHLQQPNGFITSCEEPFTHVSLGEWKDGGKMALTPALFETASGYKILISEAGLSDYPGLFLKSDGANLTSSIFPKSPLEFAPNGDRSLKITKEAGYIARTTGKREFPWRYFVITNDDGKLIENTMITRLAGKSRIEDTSWIKPGQVSWEWWNGATPYGPDVDFVSGFNMNTYKYFIDFAAGYGIPYILMDEGWAMSTIDPYTPNPEVDVHEIIRYGNEKGVGVVLWLTWLVVENNFELFEKMSEWGVAGVKIDFMDRSDQWMVDFYERVAAEAARHKLMVDFHGSFKPSGLEYAYPNVITYEGVLGMENMGNCTPQNSAWLPYTRNAVGPMDYTPGAMLSMQPESYTSQRPNSASIGTRAYQMALFVVFESGFQMLADNPTLYYNNHDCTEFIASVPVTWDETRAIRAKAGEYTVVAKRKGDKWFVGGINGSNSETLEFDIPLDFLSGGKTYKMTAFSDGINAARQAMDYRKTGSAVSSGDSVHVKMVRNGGWAASFEAE